MWAAEATGRLGRVECSRSEYGIIKEDCMSMAVATSAATPGIKRLSEYRTARMTHTKGSSLVYVPTKSYMKQVHEWRDGKEYALNLLVHGC